MSLVQYSKTSDSTYEIPFHATPVADIAKNFGSGGFIRGAVEWSYRRYVHITKLVGCFPESLRLVEKLNCETASKASSATRDALSVTLLENALHFRADGHEKIAVR